MADESLDATRAYYDEFSEVYEKHRRPNQADGYHALVETESSIAPAARLTSVSP